MAKKSRKAEALFETTRRLLSTLINEGLCNAFIMEESTDRLRWIYLRQLKLSSMAIGVCTAKVHLSSSATVREDNGRIISLVRPDQLSPPVIFESSEGDYNRSWEELDPGVIFETLQRGFRDDIEENTIDLIKRELQNSAANQGKVI